MPAPLGATNPTHNQSEFRPDEGALGLLQQDLRTLIYKLLELSILTQDPQEDGQIESRVALKVSEIISQLDDLDKLRGNLDQRIPFQVLKDIDSLANPLLITKERIERAAAENQRMTGKLQAISSYKDLLGPSLANLMF